MSQLLEYTKKLQKIEKKNRKLIFGSELSEANYELTFRIPKNRGKKIEKLFLVQIFLKRIMSQLLDNTKKNDKKSGKNQKINS